ncbi:hypothetical protein B0H21DRAFT_34530 [Amylocystis lapponica]|nr:hypothetical protein B0H21DRAFT_34530 [Amylocystis lapponica]
MAGSYAAQMLSLESYLVQQLPLASQYIFRRRDGDLPMVSMFFKRDRHCEYNIEDDADVYIDKSKDGCGLPWRQMATSLHRCGEFSARRLVLISQFSYGCLQTWGPNSTIDDACPSLPVLLKPYRGPSTSCDRGDAARSILDTVVSTTLLMFILCLGTTLGLQVLNVCVRQEMTLRSSREETN